MRQLRKRNLILQNRLSNAVKINAINDRVQCTAYLVSSKSGVCLVLQNLMWIIKK